MTELASVTLPITSILVGQRLRPVDHAVAEQMAVSMRETGQLTPVLVRPIPSEEGEQLYDLVIGGHRHAAIRKLGWPSIRAEVRVLTDAQARLMEVDENLIRSELNPLDRAASIAVRLDLWGRLYPDRIASDEQGTKPKMGRPPKSDTMSDFLAGRPATMGFAAETAGDIGMSAKTVLRALAVYRGIPHALQVRIGGSWVARSEGVLRQLAAIGDADEQSRTLDVLLEQRAKSVSDARAIAAGNTPSKAAESTADDQLNALRKAWKQASPSVRAVFREWIG